MTMPHAPRPASSRSASRGKIWSRSHAPANGASRFCAKARMVSRTMLCESFSNMCGSFAGVDREAQRDAGEHHAEHPALQGRPERAAREPSRDRACGEHETEIAERVDDDWQESEHEPLKQHAASGRIDELRKQRQIEHGDLGI